MWSLIRNPLGGLNKSRWVRNVFFQILRREIRCVHKSIWNIWKIKCFLRSAHINYFAQYFLFLAGKQFKLSVKDSHLIPLITCHCFFSLSLLQFRCCGVTNHTDWFEVYNATRVPDSCCLEYSDNCGLDNPGTWWTAVSSSTEPRVRTEFILTMFFFICNWG